MKKTCLSFAAVVFLGEAVICSMYAYGADGEMDPTQVRNQARLDLITAKNTTDDKMEILQKLIDSFQGDPVRFIWFLYPVITDFASVPGLDGETRFRLMSLLGGELVKQEPQISRLYTGNQFDTFKSFYRVPKLDSLEDQEAVRENRVRSLLSLWLRVTSGIDESWDGESPENKLEDFPWEKIKQPFFGSGISPDAIIDTEVREEYIAWQKRQSEIRTHYREQRDLRRLHDKYKTMVLDYLVEAYSFLPRNDEELTTLLAEYQFPEPDRETVMDAVIAHWNTAP